MQINERENVIFNVIRSLRHDVTTKGDATRGIGYTRIEPSRAGEAIARREEQIDGRTWRECQRRGNPSTPRAHNKRKKKNIHKNM